MEIRSVNHAFTLLKKQTGDVPFEVIKYLHQNANKDEVVWKFIYSLHNRFKEEFYNFDTDNYSFEPLWLAVVAENFIDEQMIIPIVQYYLEEEYEDMYDMQLEILFCKLSVAFPDIVMEKVMDAIEFTIAKKLTNNACWLYEAFYYIDINRYKEWFLKILKEYQFEDKEMFYMCLAEINFKEVKPYIEELIEKDIFTCFSAKEFKEALKILNDEKEFDQGRRFISFRRDWEYFYTNKKDYFKLVQYDDENDDNEEEDYFDDCIRFESGDITNKKLKIARNELCPCGSGKKYKKCCGK